MKISNKAADFKLNEKYKSRVNMVAKDCLYEIIKKNKSTCWVVLWDGVVETKTIYKNVKYNVLKLN